MRDTLERWDAQLRVRYGGRRGWARHGATRLLHALGGLRRYEAVDWGRVGRLVFVCQGNLCRSPYAEARARALGLPAASFGLEAGGEAADPVARAVARRRGLDLGRHRPRPAEALRPGDLLLGMEPWQAGRLLDAAPPGAQVSLLGLWARPARPHLQDPYGLPAAYFDTCFAVIDNAVAWVARHLGVDHGE